MAWVLASAGLYIGLAGLELYWNFPDWQPQWDIPSCALFVWTLGMLAALWFLGRAELDLLTRGLALALCLALLALALYLLPAEPLKPGLLGRALHSPLWYRAGRAGVLCLPGLFWATGFLRRLHSQPRSPQ